MFRDSRDYFNKGFPWKAQLIASLSVTSCGVYEHWHFDLATCTQHGKKSKIDTTCTLYYTSNALIDSNNLSSTLHYTTLLVQKMSWVSKLQIKC